MLPGSSSGGVEMAVTKFLSSSVQDGGSYVAFLAANEADLSVSSTKNVVVVGDTAIIPGIAGTDSVSGAGFMAFDLVTGAVKTLIRSGVADLSSSSRGRLVHINSAGEILLFGGLFSTYTRSAVIRYSAAYAPLENRVFSLASTDTPISNSLSVDGAGAAYFAGDWSSGSTAIRKLTTLTPLTALWSITLPRTDVFTTLGSDGFLYAATRDTVPNPDTIVLFRIDAATGAISAQTAFQAASNLGSVAAIQQDGEGNLYILHSAGLIKVSESTMTPVWSVTLSGISPNCIRISSGGRIYLGSSSGYLAHLSSAGAVIYGRRLYDPAGNITVNFYTLFEHSEALYAVGRLTGSDTVSAPGAMLIKFPGRGQLTGTYGQLAFESASITITDNPLSILAAAFAATRSALTPDPPLAK
jgi:hypothetical protein